MESQYWCDNVRLQQEREKKHRMIMKTIQTYKRTRQEIQLLQKLKQTTKMEIELRYKNCYHNHTYKFPGSTEQNVETAEFQNHRMILYDLHSHCEVVKKIESTKTLPLQSNRRVKSLEKESTCQEEQSMSCQKIVHRRLAQMRQPFEFLNKQNSFIGNRKKESSLIKLPTLRKIPSGKKVMLEEFVGKKMFTQNSSPNGHKLSKYLTKAEVNDRLSMKMVRPKKFFLQQC